MTFSEDQKQTIDLLCGGYAFSTQDAEEMVEFAEIGRLSVELRRMGATAVGAGMWYGKLTEINAACDTYLAKQPKGTP
jgi:hypothetical protein